MRGRAGLTRTGVFLYTDEELGVGDAGSIVRVMRTPETVFHPDTVASLAGAPITLNHPGSNVTPKNWSQNVVGNVVGMPVRVGDNLEGDVLIGDERGIAAMGQGIDEVSIGYSYSFEPAPPGVGYDYQTTGAMTVNHAAIVESGRAGRNIRIYDSEGADAMTPEELKTMTDGISKAVVDGLKGTDAAPDAIAKAVSAAVAPLADKVTAMEKASADAATEAERVRAEAATVDAAAKLQTDTIAIERKRAAVFDAAKPLIAEDKHATLRDGTIREILEAAVGDSVPNVKNESDDYLRAVIDMMVKDRAKVSFPGAAKNVTGSDFDKPREDYLKSLNKPSAPQATG